MKLTTLLTTCALAAAAATVGAQTHDVSSVFLLNSGFDSGFDYAVGDTGNVTEEVLPVARWTNSTTNKYLVAGVYQFGTAKTFLGASVPATGSDGTADGGGFVLVPDWATIARYHQDVVLTPGTYKLKANVYNAGNTSSVGTFLAWIPSSGRRTQTRQSDFEMGRWTVDSIEFTVESTIQGTIQVGYRIRQAESTGTRALLILDNVQLLRDHEADAADTEALRETLNSTIDEAVTLLGDGTSDNAASLQAAIEAARTVAGNAGATPEDLNGARLDLLDEMQLFPLTVATDGFVRGATAALGRLSFSDATNSLVGDVGFAVAEDPLPTVETAAAAGVTVRTISHNGTIYVIEGLQPATKYYYRPYVKTLTGSVRYGKAAKFYTIPKGQITYGIRDISDAATRERITNATKTAVDYWNTWTEMKDTYFNVGNDNVQTADCSYGGYIRVGNNTSYQATGTLLHEMLHGVGVIPWAGTQWALFDLRASTSNGAGFETGSGDWLGDRTTYVVRFMTNGGDQRLHGDYQHMWPYGINGASEDNHTEGLYIGNSAICQALGEDGLEHNSSHFAEPYYALDQEDDVKFYIKNERDNGGYLMDANGGAASYGVLGYRQLSVGDALANDSAAWYVTFTPGNQYYQIRNAATGRYLTFSSSFSTRQVSSPGDNQDFQLMKARVDAVDGLDCRGFWVLRHAARTPSGLGLNAQGRVSRITFDIGNDATAQRWLFLNAEEVARFDTVTGIRSVATETTEQPRSHDVYSLGGQLVRKNARNLDGLDKGVYIMDGKKYVVR